MAAFLATHDLRVIACNGGEATPSYMRMMDIAALQIGCGDFTCCACDHDFGTGVKVRCDKSKGENLILDFLYHNLTELVWPVLARMCNDAARYYKQNGK